MTTCNSRALVLALWLWVVPVWADTSTGTTTSTTSATATPTTSPASAAAPTAAASSQTSFPSELTWAVGEFQGDGGWGGQLPLLLTRSWASVADHRLTELERGALRIQLLETTLSALDQQESKLVLDADRKRLTGSLSSTDVDTNQNTLNDLESKKLDARTASGADVEPPTALPLRLVSPKGRDGLPWSPSDGATLAAKAATAFSVTGTFRVIGGYLLVRVELYSQLELRTIGSWEGRFSPEEASDRMAEAADSLRELLLGRPWAGLSVAGGVPGSRIKVKDRWYRLPWSSDNLEPGPTDVVISQPGSPDQTRSLNLPANDRISLPWNEPPAVQDKIVLETEPSGVSLYLDSQYIGPSPQTVDRPLATTRVRAQAPGWETATWEIGPTTISPSHKVLLAPQKKPSVSDTKDNFYFTLALFSISLTTTAFVGSWATEQLELADAYYTVGNQAGVDAAYSRYQMVTAGYVTGVVLTSGIFVWMMFQLGDYLAAAQASLP